MVCSKLFLENGCPLQAIQSPSFTTDIYLRGKCIKMKCVIIILRLIKYLSIFRITPGNLRR